MRKDEEIKIITRGNRIKTRRELFEKKILFHKQLARMPFKRKIEMVIHLQEIASHIMPSSGKKRKVWKISSKPADERLKHEIA